MTRYGMVIDKQSCVGCNACTIACLSKNGNPPGVYFSKVVITEVGTYPNTWVDNCPVLCNQCSKPACFDACSAGAIDIDENGIVGTDLEKCIGCGACTYACPYGARVLTEEASEWFPGQGTQPFEDENASKHVAKVAAKCDFCKEFLEKGEEPRCVKTCMGFARHFGDLDDSESDVAKMVAAGAVPLLPEAGTEPNVYYIS